ncbi:MAG: AAA family ATPase [Pseudomonadota bacterium]
MNELKDLELIIDSGTPIILLETHDERRVQALFRRLATRLGKPLYRWSVATGLHRLDSDYAITKAKQKPAELLGHILAAREPGLYLLLDFHPWLDDPVTVRLLREAAQMHHSVAHTLVLVGPSLPTPPEIRTLAARFEFSLPTLEQLEELIHEEGEEWGRKHQKRVQASSDVISALARNLAGLTFTDARRLIRNAIVDDSMLTEGDLPEIMEAKYKLLDMGGVLAFEMDTEKFTDVAGMEKLKLWLENRREVFLSDEAPPGLDSPKGLLLLGVQGGGKSLAAKAVAGAWGLPLLRLDFATLYNKYYGETERNLRESLRTASIMAPCVLWIDEIEKGLSTDSDEGGPSKRILGTLLTWMAEREEKVFLVATANDIEALPPELLRKGRFDEIFFVDLPKPEVRVRIFEIHLRIRELDPADFNLDVLAAASAGFTGAEIEQAVVSALYTAHARGESLNTEHVRTEIENTRPLSVLMAEKINYLRTWAAERTVPAD